MRELDKKMADALGKKAEEYPALKVNCNVYKEKTFGEKSKFFNTIMMDGYVFNPYIHRRWLPVQYIKMVEYAEERGKDVEEVIKEKYNYKYMMDFVLHEIEKLCMLKRYDKKAYEERSKFFTLKCVKEIVVAPLEILLTEIPVDCSVHSYIISSVFGTVNYEALRVGQIDVIGSICSKYNWHDGVIFLADLILKVKTAESYFEVKKALMDFKKINSVVYWYKKTLPDVFIEAFWKSGAYYTIKNKIMFQDGSASGLKGSAACKELYSLLENGMSARDFHEVYKSMG